MKRYTKMMMMRNGDRKAYDSRSDRSDDRRDYGYRSSDSNDRQYDAENRFRDNRGREHYDNGRYAPQNRWGMESPRNEYIEPWGGYGVRERYDYEPRNNYESVQSPRRVGFSVDGSFERIGNESAQYSREQRDIQPFSKAMGEEWVQQMRNEDGTTGAHWTLEQTKQVQAQRGIDCNPYEFWVAMNMMYSDYCKVAKELNVNNVDFYAKMAKAFLDDKDAGKDKLAAYYECIARH